MAGSNEGNEGNEGNIGSLGRSGGSGFGVLPDRVDLPFVAEGLVARQRLPDRAWPDGFWAGEWAAWLTLADFAQSIPLPYRKPNGKIVTRTFVAGDETTPGNGSCTLDAATPALGDARVGTYTAICVKDDQAQGGVFRLTDPAGRLVDDYVIASAQGSTVSIAKEVKLVLTQGSHRFRKGDRFDIEVSAVTVVATPRIDGNAGGGGCALDPTTPALLDARSGIYTLRCTAVNGNQITFALRSPGGGVPIQTRTFAAAASTDFDNQIKLRVTDTGTAFAVGDGFDIAVTRVPWVDEPVRLQTGNPVTVAVTRRPTGAGKGTCTDSTDPTKPPAPLAGVRTGIYLLECTGVSPMKFRLTAPGGASVGEYELKGSPLKASVSDELRFTITNGSTNFVSGDSFDITTTQKADADRLKENDESEIEMLIRLAEDERADALGEIVAQHDGFMSYFTAALSISPRTHPKTCLLLHIGSVLGAYASLHFKGLYQRRRPSQRAPGLLPPVPMPGHPAYPSGHSTQAHLMALCVRAALPNAVKKDLEIALRELAGRIARNREIAGLHFESDTRAGRALAAQVLAFLTSNGLPMTVKQPIPPAAQGAGDFAQRRFAALIGAAQGEWP